jgi:hypothetical protein
MRMAPHHVKHKFWWELIFISVLIYLFVGLWSQRKEELVAAAQATAAPAVLAVAHSIPVPAIELGKTHEVVAVLGALPTPLPSPLALK